MTKVKYILNKENCKNIYSKDLMVEPSSNLISINKNLSPALKIERSLIMLQAKMKAALNKEADPAVYVMSADCGTGKGVAVEKVLKDWKSEGFPGDGAIIFVSTLEEIDRFIAGAELDEEDYAVCSPDEKYSRYGSGLHAINRVPVLFATHIKAERVLRGLGSVEGAAEFLLHGKRRALWIWDEAYHAAAGASFTLHELWELPIALKKLGKTSVKVVSDLVNAAKEAEGACLSIPEEIVGMADALFQSKLAVSETAKRTVGELATLAGSMAFVRKHGKDEYRFIGKGRAFPADMGPLFVLDASARLTSRYDGLPVYGMKVVHLDDATISYERLAVHWCDTSAGKTAMRNKAERDVIFGIIANLVNSTPTEAFLLIMAKEFYRLVGSDQVALHDDLAALLDDPNQLRVANWGRHRGTNEFRDIPNIIIVGNHRYPHEAYISLALAARGNNRGIVGKEQHDAQMDEAFMDNMYQAVCRCRVRQRDGGNSGTANAYFIMRDSDRQRSLIKRAFPDCQILDWCPVTPRRKTKLQLAIGKLEALQPNRVKVSKQEIREAIGVPNKQSFARLIKDQRFKDAIQRLGIEVRRHDFLISKIVKLAA